MEIAYLDVVVHDAHGEPRQIKNAICIHEEDDAVLWRRGPRGRYGRRSAPGGPFHATVANYEYLMYWRFWDGNIEVQVRATGIMVTTHFPEGEQPAYGTLVDERTYAPFHQHFIVAWPGPRRGRRQGTVHMTRSRLPMVRTTDGLAIVQRSTPLRTEEEGKQDYDWSTQRAWKIVNEEKHNVLGAQVDTASSCSAAPSRDARSVLWRCSAAPRSGTACGSPYAEDERWPCGEFPVQSEEDSGLPAWTVANR